MKSRCPVYERTGRIEVAARGQAEIEFRECETKEERQELYEALLDTTKRLSPYSLSIFVNKYKLDHK